MTDEALKSDYDVGRGKPPVHTRFKTGRSGNPRGRPKGSRDMATLLDEELDRTVTVVVDGVASKQTMRRLIARQAVHAAAKGKVDTYLKLVAADQRDRGSSATQPRGEQSDGVSYGDADDEQVLEDMLADIKKLVRDEKEGSS